MGRPRTIAVGDVFELKNGHSVTVVALEHRNSEAKVLFNDGTNYTGYVNIGNLKKGLVKNPMYRSVQGIGYVGVGDIDKKSYNTWQSMLRRCYGDIDTDKAYHKKSVCNEWHCYQEFKKWFDKNYINGYALDKDVMGDGESYSPTNCIFIPGSINTMLSKKGGRNSGIKKHRKKYVSEVWDNLSKRTIRNSFETLEEATVDYSHRKNFMMKRNLDIEADKHQLAGDIIVRIKEMIDNEYTRKDS